MPPSCLFGSRRKELIELAFERTSFVYVSCRCCWDVEGPRDCEFLFASALGPGAANTLDQGPGLPSRTSQALEPGGPKHTLEPATHQQATLKKNYFRPTGFISLTIVLGFIHGWWWRR
jgi:hypothetical protein